MKLALKVGVVAMGVSLLAVAPSEAEGAPVAAGQGAMGISLPVGQSDRGDSSSYSERRSQRRLWGAGIAVVIAGGGWVFRKLRGD